MAELARSHGRVDIAQGGHTVAALVSAGYLEETIAVATDPGLVAAIAEGEAELEAGQGTMPLSLESLRELFPQVRTSLEPPILAALGQGIPAHEVEAEFLNRS